MKSKIAIFLLLASFIFQCNAIDERTFKSLETQVGVIQQKILALHKIKDLEDELDDQKSLVIKKSEEIDNLNDEIESLKQQKVITSNDLNQKLENQLKNIQADIANNNAKHKQEIQQLNNLLSTKSETENQNQNAQIEKLKNLDKSLKELNMENRIQNLQIAELKNLTESLLELIQAMESLSVQLQEEMQTILGGLETTIEQKKLNKFTKNLKEYSLAHDVSIVDLKLQGFKTVYNFPYSHATTIAELNSIKSQCSNETILCVGGAEGDNLLLVSCALCQSVLTSTSKSEPVLSNNAYWYMTKDYSFGFAPISKIKLDPDQDTYDCDENKIICPDNKRLSWIVYNGKGGWRLGNLNDKAVTTSNLRKIMLLDSTAIKPKRIIYSLAHNVSIFNMKTQGYRAVYEFPYSYKTTSTDLNFIKSQCSNETVLCAGGAAKGSDNLLLVSCGHCQSVLTSTIINRPILNNGAYWYFTDQKSFGFSPDANITQNASDGNDCIAVNGLWTSCPNNQRLSWSLTDKGWRLGTLIDLYDDKYQKFLFLS